MPINLSTNTLFHFTTRTNLLGILGNSFYPNYHIESWDPILKREYDIGIPMVSFCDIPISQVDNHISNYSPYGIGLKKSWGIKKKISPIQYIYKDSATSKYINEIFTNVISNQLDLWKDKSNLKIDSITSAIIKYCCYIKPYEGYAWKRKKKSDDITNFYNEREWRYVPDVKLGAINDLPTTLIFKEHFDKFSIFNNFIRVLYPLEFKPSDISYIIISKERERTNMVRKIFLLKYPYSDRTKLLLTTKIISVEQIKNDF